MPIAEEARSIVLKCRPMVALFEKIHQLDVELLFEVACQSFSLVHSLFEQLNQLED